MWKRDPFAGGCAYTAPHAKVVGFYDYPEFESDCHEWYASNCENEAFESADDAMTAADAEYACN